MKKLLCVAVCMLAISVCNTKVAAKETNIDETPIPKGFDSSEQYRQSSDYYDPQRISAREAKYEQADMILKQRKNVYSIALPLRAQKDPMWCAAAVGEMLIDYQLGPNNVWTQSKIAAKMKTDATGAWLSDQADALRGITGLNYEVTKTSDYPFSNALKADINAYAGLSLPVNLYYIYGQQTGAIGHSLAAKGYSDSNTVIFLDPWVYDSSRYGQHEISTSQMLTAINQFVGQYIW